MSDDATLNVVPTVRQKRLARGLKRLRESSTLGPDQAATQLGISAPTLRRIERGAFMPKRDVLLRALELYGADSDRSAGLIELWHEARKRGWWTAFGDVFDDTYVGLEDEADTIRSWQVGAIPGLLQTEDYARAVLEAMDPSHPDNERRVIARMARKTAINRRENPAHLHAILSEGAVRQRVGGVEVMADQIGYLRTMSKRSNITVQVVPYSAGAHVGMRGPFVLLSFTGEDDPDVAYVESPAGDLYPEDAPTLSRFTLEWARIADDVALPPEDSASMLTDLLTESVDVSTDLLKE